MIEALSHRWRSSFRFKVILATIVLITLTVTIYSGLLYWHHARASETDQKERATRLASLLAESLALPMYEFNALAVEAGVKALASHADVRRVRVMDTTGKVLVDHGNAAEGGDVLLTIQKPISHKTPKRMLDVGTVELTFSRTGLEAELYNAMFETVIGGLLMAIATVCAALWAFRSLTRPLEEITNGLDQLAAGQTYITLPASGRSDEFGRMTTAMHRFRDALVERREAEEAIRESELRHRAELEQTVAQRTTQLAEAKEVAEAANRAKSAFVANMSHEIRTPLNAVLGLAKMIAREDSSPRSVDAANRILQAGENLLGVINEILDFSKIEAGKMLIDEQPFELALAVSRAVELVRDRAILKRLEFDAHIGTDLPAWVRGDRLRVEQILINLLSNAVKFTQRGEVSVAVSRSRESSDIVFRIADTGIGMSADQVNRLFSAFEQADSSTTRKYGGTGLGLVISRSLANQMGGDVSVESYVGAGSTFTLTLPLAEVSAQSRVPVAATRVQRLRGLRVLAAEDIELNRFVLEDLLTNEGATVDFAEDGQLALDRLTSKGASAYDLVLTDIQMPVMDGYELAQNITQTWPRLPVIGLTAHAMREEREKCLACGMVAHVIKPIDEDVLVATILQYCNQPGEVAAALPAQEVGEPPVHMAHDVRRLIDWDALMHRYKGRSAFIEKLIATLLRTHGETPQKLRDAVRSRDTEAMKFLAHTLKGVSGNLEAGELYALANRIHSGEGEQNDAHVLTLELADALENLLTMLTRSGGAKVASNP
ncbi:MAG TPA: ATP-binding protein [Rhodocyclaceae bacterium]|nr:ATP-binding protein [Rhodocyclaceae bacterium]